MKVALVAPPYHSHEVGVGAQRAANSRMASPGPAGASRCSRICPRPSGPRAADHGLRVRHFRASGSAGYATSHAIWSHLRRSGDAYDLVHAHGYLTLPAVLAARGLFGRLVFSPRHDGVPRSRLGQRGVSPYRQLGRTALASADLVVCSTHGEAAEIGRLIPAPHRG